MNKAEIHLLFATFIDKTKVYRDKLHPNDAKMMLCDINTLKKTILLTIEGKNSSEVILNDDDDVSCGELFRVCEEEQDD
jgi:hypothetical protein